MHSHASTRQRRSNGVQSRSRISRSESCRSSIYRLPQTRQSGSFRSLTLLAKDSTWPIGRLQQDSSGRGNSPAQERASHRASKPLLVLCRFPFVCPMLLLHVGLPDDGKAPTAEQKCGACLVVHDAMSNLHDRCKQQWERRLTCSTVDTRWRKSCPRVRNASKAIPPAGRSGFEPP